MEYDIQLWIFFDAVRVPYTNSWSSEGCLELEYDQEPSRKLMDYELCLELTSKVVFSFAFFWQKFQVCKVFLSAAFSVQGLGLWSWLCTEAIRSTKFIKISCNYGLRIWFVKDLFESFSCVFCSQSCQSAPNLSPFVFTRNIEYQTCIKRLVKAS